MRRIRGIWQLTAILVVALSAGADSALAATTGSPTQTHVYRAFKANGAPAIHVMKTVSGSCFSGSLVRDRDDAWRCMSKNFIYDPCFSSPKAKGIVLCPAAAWKRSGVEIKLMKPLPKKFADKRKPSTRGLPWAIETTSGMKCSFEAGATFVFHHLRANYQCSSNVWLFSRPDRSHEPWTIHAGPTHPKKLHTVAVKVAWF
jgi:hypothetical protein